MLFPVLALALRLRARGSLLAGVLKPAVFRVAIPILVSLVVIRLSVRVLSATFPASRVGARRRAQHLVAGLDRASCCGSPACCRWCSTRWTTCAGRSARRAITLRNLVEGTLTAGVVLVLALWVSAAIETRLLERRRRSDLSLRKIAANVVRALLLFVGLLLALSAVGIDLTALSVLGGAIGVGLGFGLQKIAANYVSGFVILAERSLRIGDMVKVDNFEGRITDIRTRYTVIRSLNGREAIVPERDADHARGSRTRRSPIRACSIATTVQVAYGTDVRALQPHARGRASPRCRACSPTRRRACSSASFAADGMELGVSFWIRDAENGQGNVKSDVNLAVLDVLNARASRSRIPQRVVHAVVSMEKGRDEALPGPVSRRADGIARSYDPASLSEPHAHPRDRRADPRAAGCATRGRDVRGAQRSGDLRVRERAAGFARRLAPALRGARVAPLAATAREQWLNWVIRLPSGDPIGYVQATVYPDRRAAIAYELGSAWWGRGLARQAVEAMVVELVAQHGARRLTAVLKQRNLRSMRLLERLGFAPAACGRPAAAPVDDDECADATGGAG